VNHGQAVFTRPVLALYDWFVLGLTCNLIWRCSTARTLAFYARHLSANHLEVGVGTGYFLDRGAFPVPRPRVALLDLNRNCLERTAKRIARYAPEVHQADLLAPLPLATRFDSIGLNYVLHCLPGAFPEKGHVFAYLKGLLNPGGTLFGATLLSSGVPRGLVARTSMALYNRLGVFSNQRDDLDGLEFALRQHLADVRVEVVGCVALFSGKA
jgi:SAM-dependent methyltransferase